MTTMRALLAWAEQHFAANPAIFRKQAPAPQQVT